MSSQIREVAETLRQARKLLVITGAGISADSGLPTYRGVGGLYEEADTEDRIPIEEALSGPMFVRDPALTWKYIAQIESASRGAQPNAGHRALAALERCFEKLWVLTQNVDGFHRRAGNRRVIEMHGDIRELVCTACRFSDRVDDYAHIRSLPPPCPACPGIMRPNVVLFGETLPLQAVADYERMLAEEPDAVISIGTTAVFPYIAAPVLEAARHGRLTIEINPGESDISQWVDYRIRGRAVEILPALADRLTGG